MRLQLLFMALAALLSRAAGGPDLSLPGPCSTSDWQPKFTVPDAERTGGLPKTLALLVTTPSCTAGASLPFGSPAPVLIFYSGFMVRREQGARPARLAPAARRRRCRSLPARCPPPRAWPPCAPFLPLSAGAEQGGLVPAHREADCQLGLGGGAGAHPRGGASRTPTVGRRCPWAPLCAHLPFRPAVRHAHPAAGVGSGRGAAASLAVGGEAAAAPQLPPACLPMRRRMHTARPPAATPVCKRCGPPCGTVPQWVAAQANDTASPLYGTADPQRVATSGHSRGGKLASLALTSACRRGSITARSAFEGSAARSTPLGAVGPQTPGRRRGHPTLGHPPARPPPSPRSLP